MPQMSPISWTLTVITFITLLLMMMSIMPTYEKTSKKVSSLNKKTMEMKW